MSVNNYLKCRAADAALSTDQKAFIATAAKTLGERLDTFFNGKVDGVISHSRFGSQTRGTMLPRTMDRNSAVDYLIVFEKGGVEPQPYLARLKAFAAQRYLPCEILQSSPKVVLEQHHIRFELIPALVVQTGTYRIPSGTDDWRVTNPDEFKRKLQAEHQRHGALIKPTVRLAKFWNASAGYVFDSYEFERWIVGRSFDLCYSIRDCLFKVVDELTPNRSATWRNAQIDRAKEIVAKVRQYELAGMPRSGEAEIRRLIP